MIEEPELGDLRIAREAEGYFELGMFEDALERADRLLAEGKLELFALPMKAECLRSLDRFEEGVAFFERLIERDPEDVGAYVGLGWCRKRTGRLDLAVESMERLLRARPDEPIGLFNLACYCALAGGRERALDLLGQSIRADDQFRDLARKEEDFAGLREDPEFESTVSKEGEGE